MKITVITVTYNSELTLEDTIKSVTAQNFKDFEYIIMDGGSSDETLNILNEYRDIFSLVVSESDKGIYDAFNKALTYASGDIVAILNSDDVFNDDNVLNLVANEFERTDCDIVYGDIVIVSKDNVSSIVRSWKSSKFIKGSFKAGWHPPHPSFFVKRAMYHNYGNFDISLHFSADFDLMLRFMEVHQSYSVYVPQVLTRMRIGGHSQSLINILKGGREILNSFEKNDIKVSPFLYLTKRYFLKFMQFFQKLKLP